MTVYGLIASLAWTLFAGVFLWRTERVILHIWNSAGDSVSRGTRQELKQGGRVEIPNDLEALALAESEPFAQDDVRAVIREKFAELGEWQKVRRALGIGELP
jgi:hypothetical protein